MVRASTLAATLAWLQDRPDYRVFAAALGALASELEASAAQHAAFFAPSDQALRASGMTSDGAVWAAEHPEQVLLYVSALPEAWTQMPPGLYEVATLSGAPLTFRISQRGFVVPLLSSDYPPQIFGYKCLPCASALVFLEYTLPPPAECSCSALFLPSILYTTLAAAWMPSLPTISQALASTPQVGVFSAWLQSSLTKTFSQPALYTVLAPTDAALSAVAAVAGVPLPRFLQSLHASYFVILGLAPPPVKAGDRYLATTVGGWKVCVSLNSGVSRYNQAAVLPSSQPVLANGSVYVLDAVISHGYGGVSCA